MGDGDKSSARARVLRQFERAQSGLNPKLANMAGMSPSEHQRTMTGAARKKLSAEKSGRTLAEDIMEPPHSGPPTGRRH